MLTLLKQILTLPSQLAVFNLFLCYEMADCYVFGCFLMLLFARDNWEFRQWGELTFILNSGNICSRLFLTFFVRWSFSLLPERMIVAWGCVVWWVYCCICDNGGAGEYKKQVRMDVVQKHGVKNNISPCHCRIPLPIMYIWRPSGRLGFVVGMGDVVDSATKHRGSSEKYAGESIHQGKYVDKMHFSPSNCGSPSPLMY